MRTDFQLSWLVTSTCLKLTAGICRIQVAKKVLFSMRLCETVCSKWFAIERKIQSFLISFCCRILSREFLLRYWRTYQCVNLPLTISPSLEEMVGRHEALQKDLRLFNFERMDKIGFHAAVIKNSSFPFCWTNPSGMVAFWQEWWSCFSVHSSKMSPWISPPFP